MNYKALIQATLSTLLVVVVVFAPLLIGFQNAMIALMVVLGFIILAVAFVSFYRIFSSWGDDDPKEQRGG